MSFIAFMSYANRYVIAVIAVIGSVLALAYICLGPLLYIANSQLGLVDAVVAQGQKSIGVWDMVWSS